MTSSPKVLLLIPHLGGGGAEQVTALLAQGLSLEKYELHLGVVTQAQPAAESIPSWVHLHALGARRVRTGAFRLLRLVKRLKPDLILSSMVHLNFLVLLLRPFFPQGTRVLVRQNGTASAALHFGDLPCYTRLLYRLLYRHADGIICQSRAMANDLAEEIEIPDKQMAVLPNPVNVDAIRDTVSKSPNQWSGTGPHLLAVGRLALVKGFDLLLKALPIVRKRFPNVDLIIVGVGAEEAALKAMRHELGLDAAVHFVGYIEHSATYFSGASLFVLSSRHEGMPNALLEATAAGLPIVALPASGGVVDLLRGQPGAWMAAEITSESLAAALIHTLEALQPDQRFAHSFIDEFRSEHAIHAYENLIDATIRRSQS